MTAAERHKVRCAEQQLYIVLGMCSVRDRQRQTRRTRAEGDRADAVLWRELWVLLGMCGLGW